jgi:tRNA pseudouridine38-40 synthase
VRRIHAFAVERKDDRIDFVVRANAFLHHMVRNLVGTLVYVGKGSLTPLQVSEILLSKDRSKAAPTFGPEGLYLEKIEYEAKWSLPQ